MHVHLRGRQANAGGFVHGFKHVAHQLRQALVHIGHRLGDGVQARVRVSKNGQLGHRAWGLKKAALIFGQIGALGRPKDDSSY